MPLSNSNSQTVLITGGTSGLGLELVRLYLQKGFRVVAIGRKTVTPYSESRFRLFCADFGDLTQTAEVTREIGRYYEPDLIICNAGIFSPPQPMITSDGLEYTFQVNFLAHLLMSEILIRHKRSAQQLIIVVVTSPASRYVRTDHFSIIPEDDYKPFRAYSVSKFLLAAMCHQLSCRHQNVDMKCICFNPGVFSSEIFRMQKKWLRFLYGLAKPFMRGPGKIAESLQRSLESDNLHTGLVYDRKDRFTVRPDLDKIYDWKVWDTCYQIIGKWIQVRTVVDL